MQENNRPPNAEPFDDGLEEISLFELFQMMLRHIKMIAIVAIAAAVISFVITSFFITPMYSSEVRLYVNNAKMTQSEVVSSADIAASKSLVDTYIAIMQSNTLISDVVARTGLDYSMEDIKKMMSAASVNKTEVFYVRIENEDPLVAANIANAFAAVAVDKIAEYVEGSSVKVIDVAMIAAHPFSPSVPKNVAIGFLAGLVLAALAAFILEMLDTRVKSEEQLARIAAYPVIGRIPDLEAAKKGGKTGYGYLQEKDEKTGGEE